MPGHSLQLLFRLGLLTGSSMELFRISPDMQTTTVWRKNELGSLPYIHSFSVTEHYAVLFFYPLVWNGRELSTDRSGFQAMVSGGAAMDAQGRLVVGAMGTGVYIWEDDQFGPHRAGQGPVTDTVGVKRMGDQVTVIDFEGLVSLNSEGQWSRIEGVQDVNLGRRNGLIDVGQDSEGGLWGIDSGGILYQRVGTEWERCRMRNATRLDGDGDHAWPWRCLGRARQGRQR